MTVKAYGTPVRYDTNGEPLIRMRGISKTFHTTAGDVDVLTGVDVDVLPGQFVSIVGRSGSGKSTLVNMITGIDRPSTGTVEVGRVPIHQMSESKMAVWRGMNLGIVFQFFQLLPMLTLVENVMLPMDFCNIYSPASREERARALLRRVGLEQFADQLPGAVAGGQQQCAAVARALANDPPILIADEPTGNLDSHTAEQVMQIFEELAAQKKTILIVTHDRTLAQRTERRLVISDGMLINEALSAALPDAPHTSLLRLSKQAASVRLAPGAPLTQPEGFAAPVFLVTHGELIVSGRDGDRICASRGGWVDSLILRRGCCAGKQGAELLALPREEILPLLPAEFHPTAGDRAFNPDGHAKQRWFRRIRRGR